MNINGIDFKQTCFACPEQYDVYKNDVQIAYIRLRWGYLTATYIDDNGEWGETFFTRSLDDADGMFKDEEQRKYYLSEIANILNKKEKPDLSNIPTEDLLEEIKIRLNNK